MNKESCRKAMVVGRHERVVCGKIFWRCLDDILNRRGISVNRSDSFVSGGF